VSPSEGRSDLRLQALVVSDVSVEPAADVWSTLANVGPEQQLRLTPGRCVHVDEQLAGYTAEPLRSLQPGRVYEAFVNAVGADGRRGNTMGYTIRFCLTDGEAGATRLIRLPPNATSCTPR
jgi:hypothetical protein